MLKLPLHKNSPDFNSLKQVLMGRKIDKVHFVESVVDFEVIENISEKLIGFKMPNFRSILSRKIKKYKNGKKIKLLDEPEEKVYMKGFVNFFYRLGYDFVPDPIPLYYYQSMMEPDLQTTDDRAGITGGISRGKRVWAQEGKGRIKCWADFENFPWSRIADLEFSRYYEFLSEILPEGMKIMPIQVVYENVLELILGFEGFFYLLYDEPDLVREVLKKVGDIVYEYYKRVVPLDIVGGIFHGDDMGFRSGTLISPDMLRELVLPWHKKFASLAHRYGKISWFHSCGNTKEIINDLIEDVKIDAYHSFQDGTNPVIEFKKKYGNRLAVLGGVDMDKLCRLDEGNLRYYVRNILDECMIGGRYALGSGNTIANYVPIKNYLIMLEEGIKWKS